MSEKKNCSVVGCANKVVGGFQKTVLAGHFEDPNATISGLSTNWCAMHEATLKPHTLSKRGTYFHEPN